METGFSIGGCAKCSIKRANGEVINAPKDDENTVGVDVPADADGNVPVGVPSNPPRGD